eukprot:Rhum_TRINITY_DN14631_c1_g1::Rhum_TRINITY_DN14631_c1_g1_i1::g.104984::m.104984
MNNNNFNARLVPGSLPSYFCIFCFERACLYYSFLFFDYVGSIIIYKNQSTEKKLLLKDKPLQGHRAPLFSDGVAGSCRKLGRGAGVKEILAICQPPTLLFLLLLQPWTCHPQQPQRPLLCLTLTPRRLHPVRVVQRVQTHPRHVERRLRHSLTARPRARLRRHDRRQRRLTARDRPPCSHNLVRVGGGQRRFERLDAAEASAAAAEAADARVGQRRRRRRERLQVVALPRVVGVPARLELRRQRLHRRGRVLRLHQRRGQRRRRRGRLRRRGGRGGGGRLGGRGRVLQLRLQLAEAGGEGGGSLHGVGLPALRVVGAADESCQVLGPLRGVRRHQQLLQRLVALLKLPVLRAQLAHARRVVLPGSASRRSRRLRLRRALPQPLVLALGGGAPLGQRRRGRLRLLRPARRILQKRRAPLGGGAAGREVRGRRLGVGEAALEPARGRQRGLQRHAAAVRRRVRRQHLRLEPVRLLLVRERRLRQPQVGRRPRRLLVLRRLRLARRKLVAQVRDLARRVGGGRDGPLDV